jgi:hypothetical protein
MEDNKQKTKKKLFRNLRHKYRIVVQDESTFEERFSYRLSRLNVFVSIGITAIILIFGTILIISYTPLREYVLGYNVNYEKVTYENNRKVDSILHVMKVSKMYNQNIINILEGKVSDEVDTIIPLDEEIDPESIHFKKSKQDSILRAEVEEMDRFNLLYTPEDINEKYSEYSISSFFFFTPVSGKIINGFNPMNKHFGIDVLGSENDAIKATLDGTVIFSNWTMDMGYVIGIQHTSNLFSVYKHNSALLKKSGDYVKAGDPIAIIGNTGELSTGTHLHFELWFNGNPVNPQDYISF